MTAALSLLTRLPVRTDGSSAGAAAFGLVGALLGIAAAAPLLVLGPLPGAVLALGILAIASGVLHLDGLADTADALAAPNAEAAERSRQDPRVGAAGVVAIVLVIGLDAAALAEIAGRSAWTAAGLLVSSVAASRAAATLAPFVAGEARPGFGQWFADRTTPIGAGASVLTAVVIGAVAIDAIGSFAPLLGGLSALSAGVLAAFVLGRLRRGLDGDLCGAVIELSLAAGLVGGAAAQAAIVLATDWVAMAPAVPGLLTI